MNNFQAKFGIGHAVVVGFMDGNHANGVVRAVRFTASKVLYDVELDVGGEPLRDVDSTFIAAR